MHVFAGDCLSKSELSVDGRIPALERPAGPAPVPSVRLYAALAKSGGRSVARAKNLAVGVAIPAAEFNDDDGCYVAAFCFDFNSEAMPSSIIHKNDGSNAQTALLN
jgi:hypothetical protein